LICRSFNEITERPADASEEQYELIEKRNAGSNDGVKIRFDYPRRGDLVNLYSTTDFTDSDVLGASFASLNERVSMARLCTGAVAAGDRDISESPPLPATNRTIYLHSPSLSPGPIPEHQRHCITVQDIAGQNQPVSKVNLYVSHEPRPASSISNLIETPNSTG